MSGGHFNYVGSRLEDDIRTIAEDEDVRRRWTRLAGVLEKLAGVLSKVEHNIDWDLSGDALIEDDRLFEEACLRELREALEAT